MARVLLMEVPNPLQYEDSLYLFQNSVSTVLADFDAFSNRPVLFFIGLHCQCYASLGETEILLSIAKLLRLFANYLNSSTIADTLKGLWYIQPYNLDANEEDMKQGLYSGWNWLIRTLTKAKNDFQ
jgi:hypothetical protein